jgi:hypothetical protein
MRLTVSLPTLTLLKASVTPAIFLTEIPERYRRFQVRAKRLQMAAF